MPEAPHILVVDDDRRLRQLLKTYLAENGFRVSASGNAAEARAAMEGLVFDVIVLDIMMPGESGLSLTQALREANNKVPILMLSALADTDNRIDGLAAGSDDYLPKPFEPRELLLRIQNLLRRVAPAAKEPREARFGVFTFNSQRGELRKDGELVRLTTREKEFLRLLAAQGRRACLALRAFATGG